MSCSHVNHKNEMVKVVLSSRLLAITLEEFYFITILQFSHEY